MAARALAEALTPRQLAEQWGVTPHTARRRLRRLAEASGQTVTLRRSKGKPGRRGGRIVVTRSTLAAADPGWLEAREASEGMLDDVQKNNRELQKEVKLLKDKLKEVQRMLRELAAMGLKSAE